MPFRRTKPAAAVVNPLADLSNDELVAEHCQSGANSHFLSEMTRRLMNSNERLSTWLLVFTIAIFLLTAVLVWVALKPPASTWVLWASASGTAPNGVSYAGTQFPNSIYESRDGCYRAARNIAGPAGPTVLHREDQNVWMVVHPSGPDAGVRNRYECWPDTVDPRGPKGK